jgi:hypothetical protein
MSSGADKVGATSSQSAEGFMGAAIVARLNELAAISDEGDAVQSRHFLERAHCSDAGTALDSSLRPLANSKRARLSKAA